MEIGCLIFVTKLLFNIGYSIKNSFFVIYALSKNKFYTLIAKKCDSKICVNQTPYPLFIKLKRKRDTYKTYIFEMRKKISRRDYNHIKI